VRTPPGAALLALAVIVATPSLLVAAPKEWKALGSLPRTTELTELGTALDLDLFEAFDVPAPWLYATSLDARIKHHTLTRHVLQIGVFLVNLKAWSTLPPAARDRIVIEMDRVVTDNDRTHVAFDDELIRLLPGRGVTVIEPSAADLDRFRARSRPVEHYVRRTASKDELRLLELTKRTIAAPPP